MRKDNDDDGVVDASRWLLSSNSTARATVPETTSINGTVLELPPGMTMAMTLSTIHVTGISRWAPGPETYPRILSATTSDGGSDNNPSAEWLDGRLYGNTADFSPLWRRHRHQLLWDHVRERYGSINPGRHDPRCNAILLCCAIYCKRKNVHHIYGSYNRQDNTPSGAIYVPGPLASIF